MQNSEVVKCRFYQQKWEESCRSFISILERMLVNAYFPEFYMTTNYNDDIVMFDNIEKLLRIEEELWLNYYAFLVINSNYNKFDTFDAYMYHNQQLQEQVDLAAKVEDHEFNNLNFEHYLNNNYQFISNNEIMSNNLFNPLAYDDEDYAMEMQMEIIEDDKFFANNFSSNYTTQMTNMNLMTSNQGNHSPSSSNFETTNNHMISIESPKYNPKKQKFAVSKPQSPKEEYVNTKKESKKLITPMLKEFNIRFTKRENIDKKVLRKFRKYLKEKYKTKKINMNSTNVDHDFWRRFSLENILPPMKYISIEETVEYKSFNTNFMIWLMSHKGSIELYDMYLQENLDNMVKVFITKFNLNESQELDELRLYIKNLACIFDSSNYENETINTSPRPQSPREYTLSPHKLREDNTLANQHDENNQIIENSNDNSQDYGISTYNNYDIFNDAIHHGMYTIAPGK